MANAPAEQTAQRGEDGYWEDTYVQRLPLTVQFLALHYNNYTHHWNADYDSPFSEPVILWSLL